MERQKVDLAPYKKHLAELAREKKQVQGKLTYLISEEERVTRAMQKDCLHLKVAERFDGPAASLNSRTCIECKICEWEHMVLETYRILEEKAGREILRMDSSEYEALSPV